VPYAQPSQYGQTPPPPGYNQGQPGQGNLQLSATLSNVSFLMGQNYYNTLPSFNGFLYPGLALPNGTIVNNGSYIQNGQLYYNGRFQPLTPYVAPSATSTTGPNGLFYNGTFNYNTMLPGGTVVPYGTSAGYWNGYNWGAMPYWNGAGWGNLPSGVLPGAAPQGTIASPNPVTSQVDFVSYNPWGAGAQLGISLPPPGAFAPGYNYATPMDFYNSVNLNGNAAVQANLVVRVTQDGVPVEGAQVEYNGYQLPPTDANGMTTGTILYPVDMNQQLSGTVTANYNGESVSMPLVVAYNPYQGP
jgi:hypothetical protein